MKDESSENNRDEKRGKIRQTTPGDIAICHTGKRGAQAKVSALIAVENRVRKVTISAEHAGGLIRARRNSPCLLCYREATRRSAALMPA